MNNQHTPTRLPRPMGLTYLCKEYSQNGTPENKEKIYKFLISQYTLNGFRYSGIQLTISEFSQIFKIKEEVVLKEINELSINLGSFNNPDQVNNTLKSIASLSTLWAIQDKGMISNQIEILQKAQNGSYKPFISGELNRALKLGLDANKNMLDLYKTLSGQSQNILNIFNNTTNNNNYITPEQALDIIEDRRRIERKEIKEHKEENIEEGHMLPDHSQANILDESTLDGLYGKYRLGLSKDLREKSTEARVLYAPDSQGVMEPKNGLKAQNPLPEMALKQDITYETLGSITNTQEGPESPNPNIFKAPKKRGHNDPFSRRGEPEPIED